MELVEFDRWRVNRWRADDGRREATGGPPMSAANTLRGVPGALLGRPD